MRFRIVHSTGTKFFETECICGLSLKQLYWYYKFHFP